MIRTTTKTVTFARPFVLAGYGDPLPAGNYVVETDEELLDGVSFVAYRRISTVLHLHARPSSPGRRQVLPIDPAELDAALTRDHATK